MGWTGRKLRNFRIDNDLTQAEVADALGVSSSTISNWENHFSSLGLEDHEEEALEALAATDDDVSSSDLGASLARLSSHLDALRTALHEPRANAPRPPHGDALDWAFAVLGVTSNACGAELFEARDFVLLTLREQLFETEQGRRMARERKSLLDRAWNALSAAGRT